MRLLFEISKLEDVEKLLTLKGEPEEYYPNFEKFYCEFCEELKSVNVVYVFDNLESRILNCGHIVRRIDATGPFLYIDKSEHEELK